VRERQGLDPLGQDEPPGEARSALTEAMDAAHISAHTPILWDFPVVGRGVALTKRTVRLLLRWYINPIVDQQNDFNAAVVRVLAELSAEVERLKYEVRSTKYEQGDEENGASLHTGVTSDNKVQDSRD
jgi:hypothetical protein